MTSKANLEIDLDLLASRFDAAGYVVVSGLFTDPELETLDEELTALQQAVMSGGLDRATFAGDYLTSVVGDQRPAVVHYVRDVTRLSTAAHDAFHHPVLLELLTHCFGGIAPWEFGPEHATKFGVVYQDARPGEESAYTRIGWHSDHQAYPTSDFHPSIALTFHLDGTSPANGFLRVVPGSHRSGTDAMPLGFEKVAGEVGLYCERGDVLLHHGDLWHSAARATEDPPGGVRRHMRGAWHAGRQPGPDEETEAFHKNAAR